MKKYLLITAMSFFPLTESMAMLPDSYIEIESVEFVDYNEKEGVVTVKASDSDSPNYIFCGEDAPPEYKNRCQPFPTKGIELTIKDIYRPSRDDNKHEYRINMQARGPAGTGQMEMKPKPRGRYAMKLTKLLDHPRHGSVIVSLDPL